MRKLIITTIKLFEMKKFFFMGVALCVAFAFTSCKSSESAYKKAYEKAQAASQYTGQQQTPTYVQNNSGQQTTPVEVTPVNPTTTTTTTINTQPANYDNVSVRTENVEVVSGSALRAYSVVVGSFSVQSNASGLKTKLTNAGYSARVVKARVNNADWYRVVAGSYDTKNEAASFRASLLGSYPDAWLLYSK